MPGTSCSLPQGCSRTRFATRVQMPLPTPTDQRTVDPFHSNTSVNSTAIAAIHRKYRRSRDRPRRTRLHQSPVRFRRMTRAGAATRWAAPGFADDPRTERALRTTPSRRSMTSADRRILASACSTSSTLRWELSRRTNSLRHPTGVSGHGVGCACVASGMSGTQNYGRSVTAVNVADEGAFTGARYGRTLAVEKRKGGLCTSG